MTLQTCTEAAWYLCGTLNCLIGAADEWQTMTTGLLAVGAALIALRASTKQSRDQRDGRLRASRAELPASLSAVCHYAETCMQMLNAAFPAAAIMYSRNVGDPEQYPIKIEIPEFPRAVLPNLMAIVEFSQDGPVSQQIERMIREVQIFTARTRKLAIGQHMTVRELSEHVIKAAIIHALADSLFRFSRRQSEGIGERTLLERVNAVLFLYDIDRNQFVADTVDFVLKDDIYSVDPEEPTTAK